MLFPFTVKFTLLRIELRLQMRSSGHKHLRKKKKKDGHYYDNVLFFLSVHLTTTMTLQSFMKINKIIVFFYYNL